MPYVPPPPEPKKEIQLDRTTAGPFAVMKFWRGNTEFDIVIEFSKPFNDSSELSWLWNNEALTLTVCGVSDETKEVGAEIPLKELRDKTLTSAPHAQKTVSKLLVITFLFA